MNPHIPITQRFIFDPLPLASMLEEMFGQYLLPVEPGYYIKGSVKPIMVPGQFYFQIIGSTGDVALKKAILSIEDIDSDVYNEKGDVIVPKKAKRLLLTQPDVPIRGVKIIEALVTKTINRHGHVWMALRPQTLERAINEYLLSSRELRDDRPGDASDYSFANMLNDFLKPEYRATQNNPDNYALIDKFNNMLKGMQLDVQSFLGVDNWVMHFHKFVGTDIVIEKTIDYRIYDWTKRVENGEWI